VSVGPVHVILDASGSLFGIRPSSFRINPTAPRPGRFTPSPEDPSIHMAIDRIEKLERLRKVGNYGKFGEPGRFDARRYDG